MSEKVRDEGLARHRRSSFMRGAVGLMVAVTLAWGLCACSIKGTIPGYPGNSPFQRPEVLSVPGTSGCPPLNGPNASFYTRLSRQWEICFDGSENRRLLKAVDRWLGTRYRWGGCSRRGVDCSCLVQAIYRDVYGVAISRTSAAIFENDLKRIDLADLREGDILCFRTSGRTISHIGIYLKDDRFVHASRSSGVRISSLRQPYYQSRFIAAGRVHRDARVSRSADASARMVIRGL